MFMRICVLILCKGCYGKVSERDEEGVSMREYLAATLVIDCDHTSIRSFANEVAGKQTDPVD